jgi:hypothetical protein
MMRWPAPPWLRWLGGTLVFAVTAVPAFTGGLESSSVLGSWVPWVGYVLLGVIALLFAVWLCSCWWVLGPPAALALLFAAVMVIDLLQTVVVNDVLLAAIDWNVDGWAILSTTTAVELDSRQTWAN